MTMVALCVLPLAVLLSVPLTALEQPQFDDDLPFGTSAIDAGPVPLSEVRLPEVQLKHLEAKGAAEREEAVAQLMEAFSTLGAVAIVGAQASRDALQAWAKCLLPGGQQRASALKRPLADGFVRRISATAQSTWAEPLLPSHCNDAAGADDATRLGVRSAARAVLAALDDRLPGSVLRRSLDDRLPAEQVSLVEALKDVQHLEHLHVYEEARNRMLQTSQQKLGSVPVLDMHTDAGLLLAFVPPVSADAGTGPYLEVETRDGQRAPLAAVQDGTVIFFVGEAAKLLHQAGSSKQTLSEKLRPLPHSLRLPVGFTWRAWFGTMLLLPDDALILPDPQSEIPMAFGSFWSQARAHFGSVSSLGEGTEDMPVGCGAGLTLADQAGACPSGTIHCWMTCMSTKGLENCTGGTWRSSGKGDLAEWADFTTQCRDPVGRAWPHETGEMCPSCRPACTVPRAGNSTSSGAGPAPMPGMDTDGFCVAMSSDAGEGSVMYMEGFRWTSVSSDATCLAFFYGHWVIDSPWKLVFSCLGAGLLGISMEIFALCRRQLPTQRQRDVGIAFHALNLVFAYLVMLVVMMYSLELFISVIAGLVFGQVVAGQLQRCLKKRYDCNNPGSVISTTEFPDLGAGSPCCRMALGLEPSGQQPFGQQPLLQAAAPTPGAAGNSGTGAEEVTLLITGMTCHTCVGTVERVLLHVQGVMRAEVNLQAACARVQFGPPAVVSQLCSAVEEVGFGAKLSGSFSGAPDG